MAQLTAQQTSLSGLAPAYGAAAAGGDTFPNNGKTYLHVKNGGGAAVTVTVNSITPCDQGFDHDSVTNVPAAGERIIGPFPLSQFGALPAVSYSGVGGVTVAAVQYPT